MKIVHFTDSTSLSQSGASYGRKLGSRKRVVVAGAASGLAGQRTKRPLLVAALLALAAAAAIYHCETHYPTAGAPWPASSVVIPDAFGDR